eukprot:CAMPEP_0118863600 /NCGR_PEP_ID=MMETSP1163-20130328/8413_1 /TAXON_ID=124430 /ORGANISM="Phaeomonas parva, Strain CCMP2877" /LENGTH=164 /DNA_ID=CAMNT_0006797623 /DNA_START=208 /DNA_END=698 /DNA_ORIENTATION=-
MGRRLLAIAAAGLSLGAAGAAHNHDPNLNRQPSPNPIPTANPNPKPHPNPNPNLHRNPNAHPNPNPNLGVKLSLDALGDGLRKRSADGSAVAKVNLASLVVLNDPGPGKAGPKLPVTPAEAPGLLRSALDLCPASATPGRPASRLRSLAQQHLEGVRVRTALAA